MRLFAAAVLLLLASVACTHQPPASAPPSPAPAAPEIGPAPAASAAVAFAPAQPVSPFHYVIAPPAPPPGAPAIVEIAVNDQILHPGGPYVVRVTTSPDVTAVQVQAMGQSFAMPPGGNGRFFVSGSVPSEVPFFLLNRGYMLTVVAQTADGRSTSVQVPMRLER